MKKISIVVPIYNSFHMMGRCLEVLEKQTAAEIELIIVDDCSKDDSFARAIEYAEASKLNIKVLQNDRNGGPGYSRNHGLENITGDYVTFVDSDDYFSDDFTEVLAPLLENDVDCIIFDYLNVDESGNAISSGKSIRAKNVTPGIIDSRVALVYTVGSPWGKIYRSSIIRDYNPQFGNMFRNEDMPFTKCAVASSKNVYYCKSELYRYVQVQTSLMHNSALLDEKNSQIAFEMVRKSLSDKGFDAELKAIELREVLNNTVLIRVAKKQKRADVIKYIRANYDRSHIKNKYFSNQPRTVKIISFFAYWRLLFVLSLIWKRKQRMRNKL